MFDRGFGNVCRRICRKAGSAVAAVGTTGFLFVVQVESWRSIRVLFPKYKEAALLLFSVFVALMLAEVILRVFSPYRPFQEFTLDEIENRPKPNSITDPVIGWRMRPSHQFSSHDREWSVSYRANRQGFRANTDFDTKERRKKIVLAGDSFTHGFGVDYGETFGALIDAALPGSTVYNLGMPGFGLDQMWLTVRHEALPLRPDLVIVSFIGNDFHRSLRNQREGRNKPAFQLVDGELIPLTADDRPNAVIQFLEGHSWLWTAGRLGLRRLARYVPIGEWWALNKAILDQIQADCRAQGVPVLFVHIPSKRWEQFPTLRAYMQRTGAYFVDLRDGMASSPRELFFVYDEHMNAKGHAHIAATLLSWIRENKPEFAREVAAQ